MQDTLKIKAVKARARRAINGQYPFVDDLSSDEQQHLMDQSGFTNYQIGVAYNRRYLKYRPKKNN